ncbi:MAG: 50S ribosomal protein L4 [Candidatus Micrarchaeia archaeon]
MNASVIGLDGKEEKQIGLPPQFEEELRPDVIRRACHSERTFKLQPKGNFPMAGLQNTAEYYGRRHAWRQTINTGRSRLPREKLPGGRSGRVLRVPHAVKGRRAHPPKPEKIIIERINLKEKNLAIRSAIAATGRRESVATRGHLFPATIKFPLVINNSLESVKKTGDVKKVLETIGVSGDLNRAREGRSLRSGRARLRKGGYRTPKSALIVVGTDKGVWKASRNIPGVEVLSVDKLTAESLAPGGVAGRLTIWTEDALQKLKAESLYQ